MVMVAFHCYYKGTEIFYEILATLLQNVLSLKSEMEISAQTYRTSTKLDTAGFIASFICAVHCAVTPLLLASLPLAGLSFLAGSAFDIFMFCLSFTIASVALVKGFNFHRRIPAILVVCLGFTGIALGHWGHFNYHILLEVAGALLVATSHIVNHFLIRSAVSRNNRVSA